MKKYLLGMKKIQILQKNIFIPKGMKISAVFS